MKLSDAVKVLIKALNENADYRYSWQANIAMAFYDEYNKSNSDTIINISNRAADNFLDTLIKDVG